MVCFQTNAENAGLSEREKGRRVFQELVGTHDVVQVKSPAEDLLKGSFK